MNSNPLKEINPGIVSLEQLKVIGISYTDVEELPKCVTQLHMLDQLYCYGTQLKKPPSIIAQRGVAAIKKYFQEQETGQDEEEVPEGESPSEIKKQGSLKKRSVVKSNAGGTTMIASEENAS